MNVKLTQRKRIIVAIGYLMFLILIFLIIYGDFNQLLWGTSKDSYIWFFSGAFLIILGKYIAEPFFSKPTDAIANASAIIITLFSLNNKEDLFGYTFILISSLLVLFFSLLTIFLKNIDSDNSNMIKLNNFSYKFSSRIGNSKVIFSFIYVASILSYFAFNESPNISYLIILITFWICIVFFDVIGKAVEIISTLLESTKLIEEELGQAIGCENPLLYQVEIDYFKHSITNVTIGDLVTVENQKLSKSLGVVINSKQLLNKLWFEIYLLVDEQDNIIKISQIHRLVYSNVKSILQSLNSVKKVSSIELLPKDIKKKVENSKLFSEKENFVGYVEKDSNINQIVFQHIGRNHINEGGIVYTNIYGQDTLYQVINGQTREEPLEFKDRYGYEVAFARKLGYYDNIKNELNTRKWLPKIYSPVFIFSIEETISENQLIEISENAIGRLPETTLQIPIKDYNSLITHNTAILGILGIGKSRLTFELLKKIISNTSSKIICIDITNQYTKELKTYLDEKIIRYDIENDKLEDLKIKNNDGRGDNPNSWGNKELYKEILDDCISKFIEGDPRVLILNPDYHNVSEAATLYKITHKTELTISQKTRIISERVFNYLHDKGETIEAKCLLVFEEAHSLIPEWNSVANEGDKSAVNGTAKVVLQGRKYGLGTLIITQRTANISKSILNQCNTIFALRVFDDTGIKFLENYIGDDYSNTLPNLEERQAIAIGKALKLKQPVIIQLNDMKYFSK